MLRIQADSEAIKALQQALRSFAGRQQEALDGAEHDIAEAYNLLQRAEQHWRRQINLCRAAYEQCLAEAIYAAVEGYMIDCSSYAYAMHQAEGQLVRVLEVHRRVHQAVHLYHSHAQRIASMLADDLSRADTFLAQRLASLEAYHDARIASPITIFDATTQKPQPSDRRAARAAYESDTRDQSAGSMEQRESYGGPERKG